MTNNDGLRLYVCHKVVAAGKITSVFTDCVFVDVKDGVLVAGSIEWVNHHKPQVGGYYVVYEDGYTSYSPAEAFEKGYSPFTVSGLD